MKKRFKTALAMLTAAMALTACGSSEQATANALPEYVYVPEYIEMESENGQFWNAQIADDAVYYQEYSWDEETMTSTTNICKMTITEDNKTLVDKVPVKLAENSNVDRFAVDKEGNVYLLQYDYSSSEGKKVLSKYDAQGTMVYETDITAIMNKDEEHNYINSMAVDAEGRIYAASQNMIRLIDADGNYVGDFTAGDWINALGRGKDGRVYMSYYGGVGSEVAPIEFEAKKLGEGLSNFPNSNSNSLIAGVNKDFLASDGTSLLEYDVASQTSEPLLTWLDSDINGEYVNCVVQLKNGKIFAMINDWNAGTNEIALLTKTKSSDLPKKEQIVIGTLYNNQNLQAAAVDFNKANDKYHVNIKTYLDNSSMSETAWQDAIALLNNDITSGANCPDIIDLSRLNTRQLASKGVFADLMPYLEKSTVLDKNDYFENLLEAFCYNGVQTAIPSCFSLNTVIGKTSDVGESMGWTLADMIAYADANPGTELFDRMSKDRIMSACMAYNMDSFVNWETGECNFDSDEFKQLLEFVNRFPDEIDWAADQRSQPARIQDGEVLLAQAYIYDLNSIQEYIAMFNDPVTFIGYPTVDGSAGCMLEANELYAITSKSKHKDGAWAFIEHYLAGASGTNDRRYSWGLPSLKSKFEEMVEQETKEEYLLDENGEPLLDGEGNPISAMGGSSISYGDWTYEFHVPTKEEVAIIRELLAIARPTDGGSEEINKIINEEAAGFFAGQKTVDEVVNVIQSRVKIFVSENS